MTTAPSVFEQMGVDGHEQVLFCRDAATGLRAIVCIHDSGFGKALGGIRFLPYPDEGSALRDGLRLAWGMALKFAAARVPYGGAKGIVLAHEAIPDRAAMFERLGRFIDELGGRFQTGEDMGTTPDDMAAIGRSTRYVWGSPGESGGHGDPSPYTALGVLRSIEAALAVLGGTRSWGDLHVAIQGCGNVGAALGDLLAARGCRLTVCDTAAERAARAAARWDAAIVAPEAIYDVACDVFSPCAVGAVLDADTTARLGCRAVVGGANNQLAAESDAELLRQRDILYVPDFVANAGGVLFLTTDLRGVPRTAIEGELDAIGRRVLSVLRAAIDKQRSPHVVAVEDARSWLASQSSHARARAPLAPVAAALGAGR